MDLECNLKPGVVGAPLLAKGLEVLGFQVRNLVCRGAGGRGERGQDIFPVLDVEPILLADGADLDRKVPEVNDIVVDDLEDLGLEGVAAGSKGLLLDLCWFLGVVSEMNQITHQK